MEDVTKLYESIEKNFTEVNTDLKGFKILEKELRENKKTLRIAIESFQADMKKYIDNDFLDEKILNSGKQEELKYILEQLEILLKKLSEYKKEKNAWLKDNQASYNEIKLDLEDAIKQDKKYTIISLTDNLKKLSTEIEEFNEDTKEALEKIKLRLEEINNNKKKKSKFKKLKNIKKATKETAEKAKWKLKTLLITLGVAAVILIIVLLTNNGETKTTIILPEETPTPTEDTIIEEKDIDAQLPTNVEISEEIPVETTTPDEVEEIVEDFDPTDEIQRSERADLILEGLKAYEHPFSKEEIERMISFYSTVPYNNEELDLDTALNIKNLMYQYMSLEWDTDKPALNPSLFIPENNRTQALLKFISDERQGIRNNVNNVEQMKIHGQNFADILGDLTYRLTGYRNISFYNLENSGYASLVDQYILNTENFVTHKGNAEFTYDNGEVSKSLTELIHLLNTIQCKDSDDQTYPNKETADMFGVINEIFEKLAKSLSL